ncbi:MAG TPA: ABC-type transport auxiliary lipoprotein family protein [Steroidobacteraceae bacterium]|nr:ABC-type transport auxiliary lipoprotein family protein [Steroidobacteraceae bacterium]
MKAARTALRVSARFAWLSVSLAALQLALAGCAGGLHSDTKAAQVYVLRTGTSPATDAVSGNRASIHVARPLAGPGLDDEHIVLVQPDHRMSYYVASRWPAPLPEVVESLALQTLRDSGAWSAVQGSSSSFPADYILQIAIRRFEADYSGRADAPQVRVVLDCTVGKRAGREIIANFVAEGSADAGANRMSEVVAAFEAASGKALALVAVRADEAVRSTTAHEPPPQKAPAQ